MVRGTYVILGRELLGRDLHELRLPWIINDLVVVHNGKII